MTSKSLIIGFGSIGKRHADILSKISDVAIMTAFSSSKYKKYEILDKAVKEFRPNYVVIANSTHKHLSTFRKLVHLGYKNNLLIEKPLFKNQSSFYPSITTNVFCGYNLRYLDVIQEAKQRIKLLKKIYFIEISSVSFLPDWRKGVDFKKSYSSDFRKGGGVLRDLSHELDLLYFLMGPFEVKKSFGGNFNILGINSDEFWSIHSITESKIPCVLKLSYVHKKKERMIKIFSSEGEILVDLIREKIEIDGEIVFCHSSDYNSSYRKMHLDILSGENKNTCGYEQAMYVLKKIDEVEKINDRR